MSGAQTLFERAVTVTRRPGPDRDGGIVLDIACGEAWSRVWIASDRAEYADAVSRFLAEQVESVEQAVEAVGHA